ncbi:hypothetical protein BY458DRAFT_487762 [Sporodiniella umbellata]|nr:hypothetical protein BY458DRAFT_487762 [Sporodiniella umbellata]
MEKIVGINERQKIKSDPNNDIDSSEFQKKEQEINQRKDLSEIQDATDDEILKKNVSTAFEQKELDNQSVFQTQDDTGVDSKLPKDIELDSENDEKNDRKNAKKSVMDKKAVQDELQKKDTDSQKATSKVSKQEEQEVTPKAPEQKNEEKNQETTPEIPMQKTTEKQQGTNPEILKHKAEEETLDQEASKTEVAYTDTPTEGTQTQAPSQENLQKESMVASKSQSSQAIKSIFSPVEDDQQAFLDLLKATVEIWMSMWRNKRNNTDRYVQWKDIYSRLTLQNELPKVNEMMLVNENEANALGLRLAQAFIECSVLQEYIVFFAQIVQIYDEALFEDKHLYKIVDMKLCSIFKNEVHVEAIENFIYCMHHMIERVEVEEKSIKALADPDAQDVMRMLKLLLNIPLKESGREKTNIYQTKTYLFYQLMASLAEFKKNGSSYESVQDAWKSAKINSIRAPETSSVIKRLRTCFFEQLNHCIRKQSWDPKTIVSCVTSLLEPFHKKSS